MDKKKHPGRKKGVDKRLIEQRLGEIQKRIIAGNRNSSIEKICGTEWDLSRRQIRKLIARAEVELASDYPANKFPTERAKMLALEYKLLEQLTAALDSEDETHTVSESTGDVNVKRKEITKIKRKGRGAIFAEIGKCQDRIAGLLGLKRPDLFNQAEHLPDVVEIIVDELPTDENKNNPAADSDDAVDGGSGDADTAGKH